MEVKNLLPIDFQHLWMLENLDHFLFKIFLTFFIVKKYLGGKKFPQKFLTKFLTFSRCQQILSILLSIFFFFTFLVIRKIYVASHVSEFFNVCGHKKFHQKILKSIDVGNYFRQVFFRCPLDVKN